MTAYITRTPEELKQLFDEKYRGRNAIRVVHDSDYQSPDPLVMQVHDGWEVVCMTTNQKYRMDRRADDPLWDHFWKKVGIDKLVPCQ